MSDSMMKLLRAVLVLLMVGFCWSAEVVADELSPELKELAGKRVLWLGDSITHAGGYVADVEYYLRTRGPELGFELINVGLPSETVSGLSEPNHADGKFPRPDLHERLVRVLDQSKPEIVFACYGMNCGIYLPLDEERFGAYKEGQTWLHEAAVSRGIRIIHVTPPVYDGGGKVSEYSYVLDAYAKWLLSQREDAGWEVLDVHFPMARFLEERRQAEPEFVLQKDGVHPGSLGHWVMAKAILQGMGAKDLDDVRSQEDLTKSPAEGGKLLALFTQRQELLRNAWLSSTGHLRPGLSKGLPLEEATLKASELKGQIDLLLKGSPISKSESEWKGFQRIDFKLGERKAHLVFPKKMAVGHPWIWRTEFFGAFDMADQMLLKEGWVVAYVDMQNLYGSPIAMEVMDRFHEVVTKEFDLAEKVVLEGFSRGGLYAFNWAALRPEKVAAIYADAPVLDFKSWPGGKGRGPGNAKDWERCLKAYGLSEEEAMGYMLNPIDNLKALAGAKIPIIIVAGDADKVVPVEENTLIVEKRYKELGGEIRVILKPGVDHHPHSLEDPTPIVEFLQQHQGQR
ncbi:SGNH/GDSL hydrolase family protein [Lacunimicrobium album]